MEPAPLFSEIAEGPDGGDAWWLRCSDGVRIRIGLWRPPGPALGTVLLFPGRTEYVEKYGRTAAGLVRRGYATLTLDWRGQGIADRLVRDRTTGHVRRFADYQIDVAAMMAAARTLDLPRPFHLIGHSMGGCIGLRSMIEGLDVATAAFSAPMWSIVIPAVQRPFAWAVTAAARPVGLGHRLTPGTEAATYVLATSFAENRLTRDRDEFDYMRRQLTAHPELAIGGPSMTWLNEALCEMRALRMAKLPAVPAYCAIGGGEKIVDVPPVRQLMERWEGAVMEVYEGAEHEILMEVPPHRERFLDTAATLFATGQLPVPEQGAQGEAGLGRA